MIHHVLCNLLCQFYTQSSPSTRIKRYFYCLFFLSLMYYYSSSDEELEVAALFITAAAVRSEEAREERRRRIRRLYITRADLLPQPRVTSAWQALWSERSDRAFIHLMGLNVRAFEFILDSGFR